MQPRILAVASLATVAAALLVWVSAPETSVPEAEIPAAVVAQLIGMAIAAGAGVAAYASAVLWMEIPEAQQVRDLLVGRLRR